MSRFDGKTTTKLFNIFHDDYKDEIEPHWSKKFEEISGVTKEQTDACYFYNKEIPNDEEANKKLVDRKSTRLNSSHIATSRMPSSA